jgi:4-amino-4-deoxy-L-arabinose transferase-like glycosyltransferase
LLVIIVVWAAIYLPALGSLELKGEEGRRILPAIQMLETGNYIVPQVGGEPYLSKPPLVNWLIVVSFKLLHKGNEWAARLPSAICVLIVAIAFVAFARSIITALVWLTSFGLIEKGRLIEIEALYVSLFALAFIFWITGWKEKRSQWFTWIVPWIFLGFGLLAKGPAHLFFFYAIIVAVLWKTGELRAVWNLPHAIGIATALSIFAAWAIPCARRAGGHLVAASWQSQIWLALADFKLGGWLLNIPRSLCYFLPWLICVCFVQGATFSSERERKVAYGLLWGTALPLLVVDLVPGWLPRYGMPLLAPAAWLFGSILSADNLNWPRWLGGRTFSQQHRQRTAAALVIVTCICIWIYALAIVPQLKDRGKVRPIATQIDSLVPSSQPLYAVDPDFQPYLFYVRRRIIYCDSIDKLPRAARYFLVQIANEPAAEAATQWLPERPKSVLPIEDYRHIKTVLFAVEPSAQNPP